MTTVKEIQSKNDDPSLSDAQKFVGGYVEVVQVNDGILIIDEEGKFCLLYTSPSPRDGLLSRMPSSA